MNIIKDKTNRKLIPNGVNIVPKTPPKTPPQPKEKNQKIPKEKIPKEIKQNEYILLDESTGLLISINKFYHNQNWNQMHELLQKEKNYMPNLNDIITLTNLLLENKARYADGSKISDSKQKEILNEMYEVRDPWKAEWLDAKFEQRSDGLYLLSNHIIQNSSLKPTNEEKLEDTLMEDKKIDLKGWITNPNKYGLPKENTPNGDFYYQHPRDGRVARLYAGSDGAYLNCYWVPSGLVSGLGGRKKFFLLTQNNKPFI